MEKRNKKEHKIFDFTIAKVSSSSSFYIPRYNAGCADAFGSLGHKEHASCLDWLVDVIAFIGTVWKIVMSNVVQLIGLEEFGSDNPGTILNDLVDPFAVPDRFGSLLGRHDSQALALMCLIVACNTDHEYRVGESLLCLLELSHVTVERRKSGSARNNSWGTLLLDRRCVQFAQPLLLRVPVEGYIGLTPDGKDQKRRLHILGQVGQQAEDSF